MLRSIQPYTRCALALSGLALLLGILAGCLRDRPEELPSRLVWNPDVAIPIGRDSFGFNVKSGFDTSLLVYDSLTQVPEWVEEEYIDLEGNLEFDLAALNESTDDLNRILFRITIFNGFPNDAASQAYFLNDAGLPIDSMFDSGPVQLPPGSLQGNGETVEPSKVRKDALFGHDRIEPLEDATDILLKTRLFRPEVIDTTLIPYYRDYRIDVEIGAMLDLTIEF